MNRKLAIGLILAAAVITGCTEASWKREWSYGTKHKVTLYSGGVKVGEWTSTGKVRSVADEDGWLFVDSATNKLVIITGTCVIEALD